MNIPGFYTCFIAHAIAILEYLLRLRINNCEHNIINQGSTPARDLPEHHTNGSNWRKCTLSMSRVGWNTIPKGLQRLPCLHKITYRNVKITHNIMILLCLYGFIPFSYLDNVDKK